MAGRSPSQGIGRKKGLPDKTQSGQISFFQVRTALGERGMPQASQAGKYTGGKPDRYFHVALVRVGNLNGGHIHEIQKNNFDAYRTVPRCEIQLREQKYAQRTDQLHIL
jgi:hypothetical protein